MTRSHHSFKRRIFLFALLACGAYMVLTALWGLCKTAIYIHETIPVTGTVTDLRQRPFESTKEALSSGNLSTGGDMAYFPIISFTYENGAVISNHPIQTPDNEPTPIGGTIELRTYPYDPANPETWSPEGVKPNRAALLWGGNAIWLLIGLTLAGIAYLKLVSRRAPRPVKSHHKKQPKPAQKTQKAPAPKPEQEEPFTLSAEPESAPKKKRTRKPADPNAPKKPRAPRKKKEADPNAPSKPRKPRNKKSDSAA